jgi:PAS domain S-box-containing protein
MKKEKSQIWYPYIHPFRIVCVYASLLTLWIALSNYINVYNETEELGAFVSDMISGSLFTVLSSVLLFIFLKRNSAFFENINNDAAKTAHNYKSLIENLDLFICRFNTAARYTYLNMKAKEMFLAQDLNEEDVLGKTPLELYETDPEDASYLEKKVLEVIAEKRPFSEDFSYGNASYKWKLIPELDELGNIESVLSILFDVSDIEKVKDELAQKTEFLNSVIETAPMAIVDLYHDGTVASMWNKTAETVFGWTSEEVIGKMLPIIPEQIQEEYLERLDKCFVNNRLHFENLPRRNKKGETIYVDVTTCPLFDKNNNIVKALTFIEDVTQKKKNETEIRKLSEIVKQSPDGIIVTDLNTKIHYVNPAFTAITGYSYNEAIGKTPSSLHHRNPPPEIMSEITGSLIKNKFWKGELLTEKKDGEKIWISLRINQVSDEKGNPLFYVSCERDITAKKLRDEQLQRSLKEKEEMMLKIHMFSEALKQNPNSVILTDTKGTIEYVNPAFEQLTGYSSEEALGKNPMKLLHSKENESVFNEIYACISSGMPWKGEFHNRKKSGEEYWASVQIGAIKDAEGRILSSVAVEQDITEAKRQEERIKQSLKDKEIMLKEIHHRVKNNLQIVSSLLKMQSENHSNEETIEALKVSRSRIVSMALVHENLYKTPDLSRIDMKNYIDKLSMNIFAAFGVRNNKISFHSEVNDVKLGLETAIPLGLMMNEIITNSLKHAFPSCDNGEINVRLEKDNDSYRLSVKDTGIGIPKDFLTKTNGTLGKQLIKTLCSQLDGEMHINNGRGTEFLINFKELKYKRRV